MPGPSALGWGIVLSLSVARQRPEEVSPGTAKLPCRLLSGLRNVSNNTSMRYHPISDAGEICQLNENVSASGGATFQAMALII